MKMVKLLIAEEGKGLQKQIQEEFEKTNEFEVVAITSDGNRVCELALEHKPDLIILDLILPGCDGFTIMEELASSGLNAKTIITSALSQDVFISKAIAMGAAYYMVKPFGVSALVERAKMVAHGASSKKAEVVEMEAPKVKPYRLKLLEEKITNIFITVGIPAHIKGYQFLREAIKMAVDSPDIVNSITKRLYPNIAERFSTSSSKVERAIRHAIEVAWNRGRIENINSVFGVKVYGTNDKPTNGEFIALVADKMLLEGA